MELTKEEKKLFTYQAGVLTGLVLSIKSRDNSDVSFNGEIFDKVVGAISDGEEITFKDE